MANLAIKGHETRGKEVIEILEMLGAKNCDLKGYGYNLVYYIRTDGYIGTSYTDLGKDYKVFTLEEFLEKYPYKVGDKVYNVIHNENQTITGLVWDVQEYEVAYQTNNNEYVYVNCLQPYKEAPMYLNGKANNLSEEIKKTIEPVKEIMEETDTIDPTTEINLNHPCFKGCNEIEIIIPDGWEFKQRDNKMFGVRKQYPKTYEECCKVMDIDSDNYLSIRNLYCDDGEEVITKYERDILDELAYLWELKICCDAYWKMAGEQMGLGKPWEPEPRTHSKERYVIITDENDILFTTESWSIYRVLLEFPTAEMRDAFFENFKDLIEGCKEFL